MGNKLIKPIKLVNNYAKLSLITPEDILNHILGNSGALRDYWAKSTTREQRDNIMEILNNNIAVFANNIVDHSIKCINSINALIAENLQGDDPVKMVFVNNTIQACVVKIRSELGQT